MAPLTPEELKEKAARAQETRIANAIKKTPDRYILLMNQIIQRKLRLPARMIAVRSVMTVICKRMKIDSSELPWHVKEALHVLIARTLEREGGKLSEFTTTRRTRDCDEGSCVRRIYKFPPLQER